MKARLQSLGFHSNLEERLMAFVAFNPVSFDLPFRILEGNDCCSFYVHFEKGQLELYDTMYYTAVLHKMIPIPTALMELDQLMQHVDWNRLWKCRFEEEIKEDQLVNVQSAAAVLEQLRTTAGTELLQYKYWAGTPLESMIENLSNFKSTYEITQRFYIIEGQQPITGNEAMRFLQSKWMERKLQLEKKSLLLLEKEGAEGGEARPNRVLLAKKVKPSRKGLIKK